ncbi:hypothetical protein A3E39_01780 [Candidatus Uhrbacteria bacterium RIFCSPHIGHO2_12_FULL_60_25]|uniref:Uncharacterized protein n=1 Tax=Candidatus Uhrbacteria bacterium RIFCSPHIGHO2_12_FULL_60_25 TaxID=1802399 RepID=A0A1F7UNA3_9BACT|nr:MAG: hypothetical protein A3D73_04180 [Candidatus Uhrbacteria bacterium RIFCSPHIGHO2_02_FULL_60_44]OGL79739.1 MAG: hypothetical protein A3E39_01780 [Candidatus Uhrbacteria bacterium RIFCSPHIGHO2_12_FULL_60_25]
MEASMNQYLQIGNMMVSGAISKQLAQAIIEGNVQIVESLMTKGSETVYTLTLDCTQSLSDLIAQGKYDFVNDNITEKNFPIECSGETIKMALEVILVHLDERLTTKRVKHELDRRGLKLAPIDILLALGAAESDLQRKFPIVALGYSWPDSGRDLVVPELWHNGSARVVNLNFVYPDDRWDGYYRFVALRK